MILQLQLLKRGNKAAANEYILKEQQRIKEPLQRQALIHTKVTHFHNKKGWGIINILLILS